MIRLFCLLILIFLTLFPSTAEAQRFAHTIPHSPLNAPAFPGAEGFGAITIGGRGGQLLLVTTLADSGPGSLRAAIESTGPRVVVFQVGGEILLESPLRIQEPFITIAGQSAPGDGIVLRNMSSNNETPLIIKTHDVIVRYIRSRPGPGAAPSDTLDAITIGSGKGGVYNVIVDHSSFAWSVDEVLNIYYDAQNITVQWSIMSEALHCSNHLEGQCHGNGALIGSEGGGNISLHHNLFAHNHSRNPRIKTTGLVDVVNNVIYNPGDTGGWGAIHLSGTPPVNFVGNYFQPGNDSTRTDYFIDADDTPSIYVQGNIGPERPQDGGDERVGIVEPENYPLVVPVQHPAAPVSNTTAHVAYEQVLGGAGAILGLTCDGSYYLRRDAVDQRIVNDVRNGTGGIINHPSEVGGWHPVDSGEACADEDNDGLPDAWENRYGLSTAIRNDSALDEDEDGYTTIEEYLNGTSPTAADPEPISMPVIAVDAGPTRSILFPTKLRLDATIYSAAFPNGVDAITLAWQQHEGAGTATFSDFTVKDPLVEFSQPGIYTLRLTADDGAVRYSDDVEVHVDVHGIYLPVIIK